jgi:hypothetical protein
MGDIGNLTITSTAGMHRAILLDLLQLNGVAGPSSVVPCDSCVAGYVWPPDR